MTETIRPGEVDDITAALLDVVRNFPIGAEVRARIANGTSTGRVIRGRVSGGFDAEAAEGPYQGRVSFLVWAMNDEDEVTGRVRVWSDDTRRLDGPLDRPGTTKVVTAVVTARFHGTYFGADEVAKVLAQWIDGALEDRDDLRGWTMTPVSVTEFPSTDPDE